MSRPESVKKKPSPEFTPRERRAYRVGYLEGIADSAAQLDARRIRVAAKSIDIPVPRFWPTRGER